MPKNRPNPGSAQDWMARAHSDLAIANAPLPEGAYYEDLCFHAQQAAEKALKAVYRHYGHTFRYTHDLDELVTGLKLKGVQIPANIEEATSLSSFAWEARYQAYTSRFQKKSLERLFGWPEMLLSGVKKN